MRKELLAGAYGIVPTPSKATLAHPDRIARWFNLQRALWMVRLAAIGAVLGLLYSAHLIHL